MTDFRATFLGLEQDLRRVAGQAVKPKHQWVSARRAAVQAGRLTVSLLDAGALPDAEGLRSFAALLLRPLTDGLALHFLTIAVMPWLVSKHPERMKGNAGAFNFPRVKTDADGHLLGPSGKPLEWVRSIDPKTGQPTDQLNGEAATVLDDYDDADIFAHLREQTVDYADACGLLADLMNAVPGSTLLNQMQTTRGAAYGEMEASHSKAVAAAVVPPRDPQETAQAGEPSAPRIWFDSNGVMNVTSDADLRVFLKALIRRLSRFLQILELCDKDKAGDFLARDLQGGELPELRTEWRWVWQLAFGAGARTGPAVHCGTSLDGRSFVTGSKPQPNLVPLEALLRKVWRALPNKGDRWVEVVPVATAQQLRVLLGLIKDDYRALGFRNVKTPAKESVERQRKPAPTVDPLSGLVHRSQPLTKVRLGKVMDCDGRTAVTRATIALGAVKVGGLYWVDLAKMKDAAQLQRYREIFPLAPAAPSQSPPVVTAVADKSAQKQARPRK